MKTANPQAPFAPCEIVLFNESQNQWETIHAWDYVFHTQLIKGEVELILAQLRECNPTKRFKVLPLPVRREHLAADA